MSGVQLKDELGLILHFLFMQRQQEPDNNALLPLSALSDLGGARPRARRLLPGLLVFLKRSQKCRFIQINRAQHFQKNPEFSAFQ